jgi:hypothetical protein
MDETRFDSFRRALASASPRRGLMSVLGGLTLGGAFASVLGASDAQAKKVHASKKKGGKGNRKGKPKGRKREDSPLPASACPPPASGANPTPRGPGSCSYDGKSTGFAGREGRRFAQTFLAPATSITAATIGLQSNPANFSLTFEIRTADVLGFPALSVLGTTTVSNIEETLYAPGTAREVTATFPSPIELVLGYTYALVVTGPPPTEDGYWTIHANGIVDQCPDGKMFGDFGAVNNFVAASGGKADMVYTLTMG